MRVLNRLAIVLAAAAVGPLVGCDTEANRADTEVRRQIEESRTVRYADPQGGDARARELLESAANNASTSQGHRALAKAMQAESLLQIGSEKLQQVERLEQDLGQLMTQVAQLGTQVTNSNVLVAGYGKLEPTAVKEAIQQKIAEAQGGPNKSAWFTHGSSVIPTLSTVNQDIARLEGEIARKQDEVKQLQDRRTALLNQAEEAGRSADAAQGQKAVDEFKRASGLRKEASDLATQIDLIQASMIPLRNDLAVAQGQQAVLNELIKQLQDQIAQVDAGWAAVQEHAAAQAALAKQILAGTGQSDSDNPVGGSVTAKANAMAEILSQLNTLRAEAREHLDQAYKLYGDAYTAADAHRRELDQKIGDPANQGKPEQVKAWKNLIEALHPSIYKLQQATAGRLLGSLHLSSARSADARARLVEVLAPAAQTAGVELPASLQPGNLDEQRKQDLSEADARLKDADGLLEQIAEGQSPEAVGNAARVARVLTQYLWSQVANLAGDAAAAQQHLEQAKTLRDNAAERNIPLPALPAEMGAPPAPAAPPAETPAAPEQPAAPRQPAAPGQPAAPEQPAAPAQ